MTKRIVTAGAGLFLVALACVVPLAGRQAPVPATRIGFTPAALQTQLANEGRFASGISTARLSELHRAVSRRPHMAGSDGAREVADYLRRTLQDAGLDVAVHEYQAHLSHPVQVNAAITAPAAVPLSVTEPVSNDDPDSRHPELGPGFIAYSASGTVEAPVVYVNYGLPADYARLKAAGIDVKGRLAMARYGRSHRAVKVHTAQEQGAVGLILYSDPADDGFARGVEAPDGFWRGPEMLQRGNAKLSWFWHGDPLTPGVAALPDAERVAPETAPTLPRIPVVALSWTEARKVLERLDGPAAPTGFQGGLPFTYRLGPSLRVRLAVQMDNGLKTIRNVVARVPGRTPQKVLFGTHHDAWTFGAIDPGTAMAVLLEMATNLGRLRKAGWTPERGIEIAFWDAEEFGLVGSTEHAEHFQRELRDNAVAYVNTDMYYEGRFDAGGVASLRDFIIEVARDVPDGARSVYDGWQDSEWSRQSPERRRRGREGFEVELRALGSGADFVPFQVFLGLPTLSLEFIGPAGYGFGTYHSNYDSRAYFDKVADPGFRRGAILTRLLGITAMRMADAEILPFRMSHYGRQLATALADATAWGVDDDGRRTLAIDTTAAEATARDVTGRAAALERDLDRALAEGRLPLDVRRAINTRLARLEQRLLEESQPPRERWFRHVVHGWNIYSLYDGQPFPGLAEAVRLRDEGRRDAELRAITAGLSRLAAGIDEIRALVPAPGRQGDAAGGRVRARDLGITIGPLRPGPNNAITDVAGVLVGHATIVRGEGPLRVGEGPVRTGVTAVLPRRDVWFQGVYAATHTLNGDGEMTGVHWIRDMETLVHPILITNTGSVGAVHDAAVRYMTERHPTRTWATLPVVAETWDGQLNDVRGRHVGFEHVAAAIDSAAGGPVAEGNVGGGTGMVCFRFKCGIGTSSRVLEPEAGGYTVGVLVQANFGGREQLRVDGVPVGREIPDLQPAVAQMAGGFAREGSIIVVVATDAPLSSRQLERVARRAALGIARTGGTAGNTSGDIILAFSTANAMPLNDPPRRFTQELLSTDHVEPIFRATVDATEEAILNALTKGATMQGIDGRVVHELPYDRLSAVMSAHGKALTRR